MYLNVIAKSFRVRLLTVTFVLLIALILINTVFFYRFIDSELGDLYSQRVSAAYQIKAELLRHTLSIYGLFALICFAGIVVVTVLYTHRVVGPLVALKRVAARVAEGDLDEGLRFRKTDAVKPLADALNDLSSRYRERYSTVYDVVDGLQREVQELSDLLRNGDLEAAEEIRARMAGKAEEVNRLLAGIKV